MIKNLNALRKNELGFTLIEVMVVIIMVGILAAIAVPIYSNYVYRARSAEAVTTLGAIKTYMLERQNATGSWPHQVEMDLEFQSFNELYYFNTPVLRGSAVGQPAASNPHIAVRMVIDPDHFGVAGGDWLQLDIDITVPNNNGWSGTVRTKWAKHLPAIAGTPIG